jgi:hypothetical protein
MAKKAESWRRDCEQLRSDSQVTTSKYDQVSEERLIVASEKARLENELRRVQVTMFRLLKSSQWMSLDTGTISPKLDNIRANTDKVAKAYSATAYNLDAICRLPTAALLRLRSSLEHVVYFKAEGADGLAELKTISQACRLCLTALISHEILWCYRSLSSSWSANSTKTLDVALNTIRRKRCAIFGATAASVR